MKSETIVIKELSKQEIPDVIKISSLIFNVFNEEDKYHNLSLWEERMNKNGILLGAFLNEKLIGYKFGYEKNPERFHSWMGGVLEEFRGQGIATTLLNYQEDLVRKRGYKCITVRTIKDKYPAMFEFLLKHGYVIEATSRQEEPDSSIVIKSHFKKQL